MKTVLSIIIILLAPISIWEYIAGMIIDVAFTGILARREEVREKFLVLILSKFFIWMFFLAAIFMTYQMLFVIGSGDLRRVRADFIIFFFLFVLPFAMVRQWYASWIKKIIKKGSNSRKSAE
jgi:hypothetical protein